MSKPVYNSIVSKLTQALSPVALIVKDSSQQHSEHAEMARSGFTETHFEIDIVSDAFTGISTVQRHRLVYKELDDEFKNKGLHAVSIKARTPLYFSK